MSCSEGSPVPADIVVGMVDEKDGPVHVHSVRIRPVDCDRQGIVHASRYAVFCEAAMIEALRAGVGGYQTLDSEGVDFVLAEFMIRYLAPARFDELLRVGVHAEKVGKTSLTIRYDMTVEERRTVTAVARYVQVDTTEWRKVPLVPPVRAMFSSPSAAG
jgi:acyl-CoA thioester hydrolase